MGKGLFKYITLLFMLFLLLDANAFAFEVNKTAGGANIKWSISNVSYYINPSGGPSNNSSAIQAAMQTWTDVTTSYFTFVYSGTTASTLCGTNNGYNIVCYGPMGLNGILAQNSVWYNTGSGEILDSDIEFNTSYPWATDGSPGVYDVQNVGTHEFGHSLSLADLYSPTDSEKTMYGYASVGETQKRTLHQDDIDGITYLYPGTSLPTGTITINAGANYTKSTSVSLTLSCTDTGGSCSQMQFSNDNTTWSTPEAYATTKSWTLTPGDGTKTVYVKFKDNDGNWSTAFSDTIVLDTTSPTTTASPPGGTYASEQGVTLTCNDGAGSGCGNIYYTTDGTSPTTGSPVYSNSINIATNTILKFFAVDLAGNEESIKTDTYVIYLTIKTSSLPSGAIGIPYNQTLTATGGVPPYTWSITSGNLPNGLTLNNSTGVISGTPTIPEGPYSFIVQVMDTVSSTATKNLSITIYLNPQDLPVKVSDSYYSTVQDAYDACSDDYIIQIRDTDIYEEEIYFDHDISITIKGGYNSDFTSNPSYTRIHGNIIISNGSVVTENIVIQ